VFFLSAETKASATRTLSNSLGKRRQCADDVVSSKHLALHNYVHAPLAVSSDWVHRAVTSTSYTSQQPLLESATFNELPYNYDMLPLHVAPEESSPLDLSEPSHVDQVSDASSSSQIIPTLVASASHVFALSAQTAASFPSQNAADASVHPLLSMVQQVIPPLHDYSPPLLLSHAVYPSHGSPQPSHQALQSSHHAVDLAVSSGMHQASTPMLLSRTTTSATRGSSSHKLAPPTPKVIIVSGTGMSSATTIAGPPPNVTTSVVTKPAPGTFTSSFLSVLSLCCFHLPYCGMSLWLEPMTDDR